MKRTLVLGILSFLILASIQAFADVPGETTAGVIITADGAACNLNYTDSGNGAKPAVTVPTIGIVVAQIYGWDYLTNLPDWNYTYPTQPLVFTYITTNEGNGSDYIAAHLSASLGGPAGFVAGQALGWTLDVSGEGVWDSGKTGNFYPGWNVGSGAVVYQGKGQTGFFNVTVTPSTNAYQSPDGAYMDVTFEVFTYNNSSGNYYHGADYDTGVPSGVYFGANAITYGGTYDSFDSTITCIKSALMTLTRTATVDAPATANGKYTGGAHDAVPGSVITYTLYTSNEGSVPANNVQIINAVPYVGGTMTTWLCHVGAGQGFQGSVPNVTITAPSPDATGWNAYYSVYFSPMTDYGFIGNQWVTVGAWPAYINSQAMWVKFEKNSIASSEGTKKLTWGVTIR